MVETTKMFQYPIFFTYGTFTVRAIVPYYILPFQAIVITDVFALYVIKRGKFYQIKKYEEVDKEYEQKEYGIISDQASSNEGVHLLRTIQTSV